MDVDTEKRIPHHPSYRCTKDGIIIGSRGKPLKSCIDRHGYEEVVLCEKGVCKSYLTHRLILCAFKPRKDSCNLDVNHINGDKKDNRLENLEWCTRSDNVKHSYANGLQTKVTNPYGTYNVLTQNDIEKIRELHFEGLIDSEIAEKIGCSRGLVSRKIREMKIR